MLIGLFIQDLEMLKQWREVKDFFPWYILHVGFLVWSGPVLLTQNNRQEINYFWKYLIWSLPFCVYSEHTMYLWRKRSILCYFYNLLQIQTVYISTACETLTYWGKKEEKVGADKWVWSYVSSCSVLTAITISMTLWLVRYLNWMAVV